MKTVAVIGAGPAGLAAAEVLAQNDVGVRLFEAMPSLGRKFLLAGKSGLNLTHAEPFEEFVSRYGQRAELVRRWLSDFPPEALRAWADGLGARTFVGSSGRVFPRDMKASPLLRAWLQRLNEAGVKFHLRHRWAGFSGFGAPPPLRFETPDGEKLVPADAVILALGGGSWRKTGSDAKWIPILTQLGAQVAPLKPANCGFDVAWSEFIRARFNGSPVKSVVLKFKDFRKQGEFILTPEGVEGGLIYFASALIREEIEALGKAVVFLDLLPDRTREQVVEKLSKPRGSRSMASHLEKTLGLKGVKAALLHECAAKETFADSEKLADAVKALPVPLLRPRPLEEAISSAGGVTFDSLDESLMLKKIPGVFCAGEMLDWEAPTGGYLITACMASGRWAAKGALRWLECAM